MGEFRIWLGLGVDAEDALETIVSYLDEDARKFEVRAKDQMIRLIALETVDSEELGDHLSDVVGDVGGGYVKWVVV